MPRKTSVECVNTDIFEVLLYPVVVYSYINDGKAHYSSAPSLLQVMNHYPSLSPSVFLLPEKLSSEALLPSELIPKPPVSESLQLFRSFQVICFWINDKIQS